MDLKFASDDTTPEDEASVAVDEVTTAVEAPAPMSALLAANAEVSSLTGLASLAELEGRLLELRGAAAPGSELAAVLGPLARAQAQAGMNEDALTSYREATEALRDSDDYAARGAVARERGDLERALGMFVEAQRSLAEAAQAFALGRDEKSCAACWYGVGNMRIRTNRASGAAEAYEQAAKLYAQCGETLDQAHATFCLAEALRETQPVRAVGHFARAGEIYSAARGGAEGAPVGELPDAVQDPRGVDPAILAALCERSLEALAAAGFSAAAEPNASPSWTRAEVTAKKKTPLPLLVAAGLAVVVALYAGLSSQSEEVTAVAATVHRPPSVATGEVAEMPAPARKIAEGLLESGAVAAKAGNYDEATRSYDQAIELFRQGKRAEGEAAGLLGRAELEMARARPNEARRVYQELLKSQRQLGDTAAQMRTLQTVVSIDEERGDAEALRESYSGLLVLHELAENRDGQVALLQRLVALEQGSGRLGSAREVLMRLRMLYDSAGDAAGKAATLESLAAIDLQVGRVTRARDQLNQAFVIYRESDASTSQARALVGLGDIDRGEGRPEQARASYRQALRLYENSGDAAEEWATRLRLADIEADLKHEKRAVAMYGEVLAVCERGGDRRCMGDALQRRGRLAVAAQESEKAKADYARAAALYAEIGAVAPRVEVTANLAALSADRAEADRLWAEAVALSGSAGDPSGQAAALATLAATAAHSGDAERARDTYTRALSLYQLDHNVVGQMQVLQALRGLTRDSDADVSQRYAAQLATLQTETDASLRD